MKTSGATALILGGDGFISRFTALSLVDAGFEVSVLSNRTRPAVGTWIEGDRSQLGGIPAISKRWDCVIDNSAYSAGDVSSALRAITHSGIWVLNSTVSVYRYVERASPTKTSARPSGPSGPFTEAMNVHGPRPHDEDPSDEHWRYARGKIDAEAVLMQSHRPYAILRPTMVFGPNDISGRTQWYVSRLQKGEPINVKDRGNRFHLVSPQDVGRAFALIAAKNQTGIFNVAGRESLTLKEFVKSLAAELDTKPNILTTDPDTAQNAGPYFFDRDWSISSEKLMSLGFNPTPWTELAGSLK